MEGSSALMSLLKGDIGVALHVVPQQNHAGQHGQRAHGHKRRGHMCTPPLPRAVSFKIHDVPHVLRKRERKILSLRFLLDHSATLQTRG